MRVLAPGIHSVDIDGVPQIYEVRGTGPVCLVHSGGPGIDSGMLRLPLLERFLTMVYMTQIGTTDETRLPTHPDGYTLDTYAHFVQRLIEHLDVPKVFTLGFSAGGFVVERHAIGHQDRLQGIILYDTTPTTGPDKVADAAHNFDEFCERNAGRPELAEVIEGRQEVINKTDDASYTSGMRKCLPAYFADYWGRENEFAEIRSSLRATYVRSGEAPFDHRGQLAGLRIPTLVIVGRHDFMCSPRWAREMHDEIPGSTLVVLENSGHFGHVEEPEGYARAVADFAAAVTG
jgi:proline iminopeptidase